MGMLESPEAQRNGQIMLCPVCQVSLKLGLEGDGEVDFCEKCHGLWVDNIEERHILELKPQVFTVDELRRFHKLYHPLGKVEPVRYIPCPVCRQLMNRKNWGEFSGVVVNNCDEHGTWFSSQEQLEKIKEYIALGGIEYQKFEITHQGIGNLENKLASETLNRTVDDIKYYYRGRFYKFLGF